MPNGKWMTAETIPVQETTLKTGTGSKGLTGRITALMLASNAGTGK